MKKALCFILVIVVIASVVNYGTNKRFSVEVMITNLTNFQDMPTLEDLANIWKEDSYYLEGVLSLQYWVDNAYLTTLPFIPSVRDKGDIYALALDDDGNFDERFIDVVEYRPIYLDNTMTNDVHDYYVMSGIFLNDGTWHPFEDVNGDGAVDAPVIVETTKAYNDYTGDNEILNFFGTIKAFFIRLWNSIEMIFQMIFIVFRNLQYLLPWNSYVVLDNNGNVVDDSIIRGGGIGWVGGR